MRSDVSSISSTRRVSPLREGLLLHSLEDLTLTLVSTPWGPAQGSRNIAEGITFHTTSSHGGIELSPTRLAMPAELRNSPPWAGEGWYEEDCDWAIVALAFPQHFSPREVRCAVLTVRGFCPRAEAYVGSPAGATVRAIAEQCERESSGK